MRRLRSTMSGIFSSDARVPKLADIDAGGLTQRQGQDREIVQQRADGIVGRHLRGIDIESDEVLIGLEQQGEADGREP